VLKYGPGVITPKQSFASQLQSQILTAFFKNKTIFQLLNVEQDVFYRQPEYFNLGGYKNPEVLYH